MGDIVTEVCLFLPYSLLLLFLLLGLGLLLGGTGINTRSDILNSGLGRASRVRAPGVSGRVLGVSVGNALRASGRVLGVIVGALKAGGRVLSIRRYLY